MYTGITKGLFPVSQLQREPGLLTYSVTFTEELLQDLSIGASVSINGVCQTVTAIDGLDVSFQAMQETLSKTTLDSLQVGDEVSVERSAKLGDENGGHAMYGHVEGVAEIIARQETENNVALTVQLQSEWMAYVFDKGFIGLDGSSLTVCEPDYDKHSITVNLIPQTLELTNFDKKQVGDKINVELDAQAKTMANLLMRSPAIQALAQRLNDVEQRITNA